MRLISFTWYFAPFFMLVTPSFARAPGAGWISKDEAFRKVQEYGYGKAVSIEATKDFWQVTSQRSGKIYVLTIEPLKGEIAKVIRHRVSEEDDDDEQAVKACKNYIGEKCNKKK